MKKKSNRKFNSPRNNPISDLVRIKMLKEIEILNLKISDVKKKWYSDPQWAMAVATAICGAFSFVALWSSGVLQTQSTLNKIEAENTKKTIDSVQYTVKNLTHFADSLREINQIILSSKSKLEGEKRFILKMLAPNLYKLDSNDRTRLESIPEINTILVAERESYCDSICYQARIRLQMVMINVERLSDDDSSFRAWEEKQKLGNPETLPRLSPSLKSLKRLRQKLKDPTS